MVTRFARLFEPLYERWRADIRVFAKEGMRFEATWQQKELFDAVQLETILPEDKRLKRIAVASGQGPGKTSATVIVALWRCMRYPDALCIVTAPSMRQCRQWVDEAKRLLKDAHPLLASFISCLNTRIDINGSAIWGIRTATATRPENLQGIHEKRLTFIGDEASGISRSILETIKGTLSNPDALLLLIGNPNTTDCDFFKCFTTFRDQWHCMNWNAEDTARDYPHIVSPSRNRALELEYGRDSDVYRVRVMGLFPNQDPNALMSIEDLIACTKTSLLGCSTIKDILPQTKAIGIDYARFGGDESCVVQRVGLAVINYKVFVKCEPREVTDYAFRLQHDAGWANKDCYYVPDAGGMGQGLMASFWEAGKNVHEFHTQSRPADTAMYADAYSEAWWCLRNLVKEHICHLPNDARLLSQLSSRQYYMDRKGKIKVETKDEWRDRTEITESPDRADAVAMCFYPAVGGSGRIVRAEKKKYIVGSKARVRRNR